MKVTENDRAYMARLGGYQEEAVKVCRNLDSHPRQMADYVIERCGEFMYDWERALLIAAFFETLRPCATDPANSPAGRDRKVER